MDLLIHKVQFNEDWGLLTVHLPALVQLKQKDEITDYIIKVMRLTPHLFLIDVYKYIHLPRYNYKTEDLGLYLMITDEDISEDAAVDLMYKHLLGEI